MADKNVCPTEYAVVHSPCVVRNAGSRSRIVRVAAVRLTERDCGQRRQGKLDYVFSIVGDFLPKDCRTWKPQAGPIPLDATQAAKIVAVDGACGSVVGELLPEPAVTALAESVFVEVIVDQRSQIEQGV
jgi:hypothetical protein